MEAVEIVCHGIKCDACPYEDKTARRENYLDFLNKPCPDCGANLLTQEDMNAVLMLELIRDTVNKEAGDVSGPKACIEVKMDGTGSMDFELKGIKA